MNARRTAIGLVYVAGLGQGLALVTPPAAGNIFTSAEFHGLSSSEYGSLFLPLVIAAILASGGGGPLARRWRLKGVLLLGFTFNVVAMGVLAASTLAVANHMIAFGTLLAGMAALGAGFGFTITALNTYGVGFFPDRSDVALTALHGVLGTGTALAPVLVALLSATGSWWMLPVGLAAAFTTLGASASALSLDVSALNVPTLHSQGTSTSRSLLGTIPGRLWAFGAAAVLYGICETVFGNWAVIYLRDDAGLSARWAGLGLAAFWAMVTLGRLAVAVLSVWLPARRIYLALPILLLLAFVGIPQVSGPVGNLVAFGFAGLACSAVLPLTISFAGQQYPHLTEIVSGGMMATYMVGYGVASFGVGALRDAGDVGLSTVYTGSSLVAAGLFVLAWILGRTR